MFTLLNKVYSSVNILIQQMFFNQIKYLYLGFDYSNGIQEFIFHTINTLLTFCVNRVSHYQYFQKFLLESDFLANCSRITLYFPAT